MYTFPIYDPNAGLGSVLRALKNEGITENSRNGPVLRFPKPVCLEYLTPTRRVLNSPIRDANPFFHLFETMWMFAGMDEIQPLLLFNGGMAQYSDDGKKLRGTAYGYRWRTKWNDQLARTIQMLRDNPETRQIVVSMWDPMDLFLKNSKDYACNLQVMFSTRPPNGDYENDKRILDMTVTNRSNDLIYGAMGSNMFHFSMLLEYVAMHSAVNIGTYYQISNNLHLYTENETAARCLEQADEISASSSIEDSSLTDLYLTGDPRPIRWYVEDHEHPLDSPGLGYLRDVVRPLVEAYRLYKSKSVFGLETPLIQRLSLAQAMAANCKSITLKDNAVEWFERRKKKSLPTLTEGINQMRESHVRPKGSQNG